MRSFKEHQRHYRQQHSTVGCKITHMIGIPMIAISIPLVFFNRKAAVSLFGLGWACQFLGHYVFEKNDPVFMSKDKDPLTVLAAFVFVGQEWCNFLSGKPLNNGYHDHDDISVA